MAVYTNIDYPQQYFQCTLYTGNETNRTITLDDTDANTDPDFVWIKARNDANSHELFDSVRGVQKPLSTDGNGAEGSTSDSLTAFNTDGFNLGAGGGINGNSDTLVAWCWKGGTTSGITTGGASVTPAGYSFSAAAGQSIITWTGTGSNLTVPHGLGAALGAMFVKCTSTTGDWVFFHKTMGGAYGMELPSTSAKQNTTAWFNSTAPDADKFTIGTNGNVNTSGRSYVAYCFADVQGYSKFGSYTGNGSGTNAPFIYLGFKPAFVMFKRTDSTSAWSMQDSKRIPFNEGNKALFANSSEAESTSDNSMDFVSNGFRVRTDTSNYNTSGGTYIFVAFAENPFTSSTGVPNNAR